MPAPHGHEPTDQAVLARLTSPEKDHLKALAQQHRTSVNASIRTLIQASMDTAEEAADPSIYRVRLSPRAQAYLADRAAEWNVTPEHAIQQMILDSFLNSRPGPSQAPAAPPGPERPKHPGGTRKQRERARAEADRGQPRRRTDSRAAAATNPALIYGDIPTGFRAPDPDQ